MDSFFMGVKRAGQNERQRHPVYEFFCFSTWDGNKRVTVIDPLSKRKTAGQTITFTRRFSFIFSVIYYIYLTILGVIKTRSSLL